MKTLTQTKLGAFLSATLSRGPASLADLVASAKHAGFKANERAIEEAVFLLADANLETPAQREANRARFGENSERWPRGQSPEIVAAWRGIAWHLAGNFSARRPTKGAK